jgi:LysR family transcriptional regulator, mexEF-oprN operon transcriptional activator
MKTTNFTHVDLNLLTVFAAVMRARNTTRAAEALFITQPAVSHALKRLRALLNDALFVRSSRGLIPTPRAQAMWEELEPMLGRIERLVMRSPEFDPATSEREFRIGLPSALDVSVTPELLKVFRDKAPQINLSVRPTSSPEAPEQLDRGDVEIAMSVIAQVRPWQVKEVLGKRGYLCLFAGKRMGIKAPISLKRLLSLPHVLTSFGGDRRGIVDEALEARGLKRRVLVASPDFAAAANYLHCADAVAVLPEYAARRFARSLNLTVSRVPIELPPLEISMAWHSRYTDDPAHRWFRQILRAAALKV